MRSDTGSVGFVFRPVGCIIATAWIACTLTSLADTRHHEQAGSSSMILGGRPYYTSDGLAFAQMDDDAGLGVMGIAVGDLDGDDRAEIVTCEVSDGGIDGQIAIYSVDPVRGIERIFARNGFTKGWCVLFLGVFRSGGAAYLFVEQRKEAWKSAFVLEGSRAEGFELVAVTADRLRVYADGLRSTMAYSAERRAYARFLDRETIEFVPE